MRAKTILASTCSAGIRLRRRSHACLRARQAGHSPSTPTIPSPANGVRARQLEKAFEANAPAISAGWRWKMARRCCRASSSKARIPRRMWCWASTPISRPRAKATGLIAPHGVDLSADLALPIAWNDADFVPYDWGYFAFVYDTEKLPGAAADLADLHRRQGCPEDPHPGSAHQHAGPRPRHVAARGLWRQGDGCLGGAEAQNPHRHQGLERGLWPLHARRSAAGSLLHHLARLSSDRREQRTLPGAGVPGRELHADRGGGAHRGLGAAGAGQILPAIPDLSGSAEGHPHHQLHVSGARYRRRSAGAVHRLAQAGQVAAAVVGRRRANRDAWIKEWIDSVSQ
jgi:hypothetical protein